MPVKVIKSRVFIRQHTIQLIICIMQLTELLHIGSSVCFPTYSHYCNKHCTVVLYVCHLDSSIIHNNNHLPEYI